LQRSSDHLAEDVGNAANIVMQIGMAKLAQTGGRAMQAEIRELGGIGYAARQAAPARAFLQSAGGVRGLPGATARALGGRLGGLRAAFRGAGGFRGLAGR